MATRWSHVGLNCADLTATENFYSEWFGFKRARFIDAGDTKVLFLRAGDAYLELFQVGSEKPYTATDDGPQTPGLARHVAFQVDDLEGFLARADGRVDISFGPLRFDEVIPGWQTVWVRDPDGVIVEVSEGYQDE